MKRGADYGPHDANKKQRFSQPPYNVQTNHHPANGPMVPSPNQLPMGPYYPGIGQLAALNGMSNMGMGPMGGMGPMNGMGGMGGMQMPPMGQIPMPQQMPQMPQMMPMGPGPMGMGGDGFGQFPPQAFQQPQVGPFSGPAGFVGQFSLGGGPSSGVGQFPVSGAGFGGGAPAPAARPDQRTVYLGNLPPNTTIEEVLNNVKTGMVEQAKVLDEKNCAFVTFVDAGAAAAFYTEYAHSRLTIYSQEIKVGWGKPLAPVANILSAIGQGASRNVFIGNIDDTITERVLRDELSRFGQIDQIKILVDKRIAFVHMAGVSAAIKAVQTLQTEDKWAGRRINYGKDRCAPQKSFGGGPGQMHSQPPSTASTVPPSPQIGVAGPHPPAPNGNRTVYLGGLPPETTIKELCDNVRGGILQNVKYFPDKGIGFVTFMSSDAAASFHYRSSQEGLIIHGKRIKIGWGKGTPIPQNILAAVQQGATRNVYVGNIDLNVVNEDSLRREFQEFGDIEMINIIPDKSIAFINFTDIANAVKAVEAKRADPNYSRYRTNYGKDRCANPPKPNTIGSVVHGLTAAVANGGRMGDPVGGHPGQPFPFAMQPHPPFPPSREPRNLGRLGGMGALGPSDGPEFHGY